jgi:hypothetical protein
MKHSSNAVVRLAIFLFAMVATGSANGQQAGGCGTFYRKDSLAARVIDKKPVLSIKDIDAQHFQLLYEEGYHKKKTLNIFKNAAGLQVFAYIKVGDRIKKKAAETSILVIRSIGTALDIQSFDLSCSP